MKTFYTLIIICCCTGYTIKQVSVIPVNKVWKLKTGVGHGSNYQSIRLYLDSAYNLYVTIDRLSGSFSGQGDRNLEVYKNRDFISDSVLRFREKFTYPDTFSRTVYIKLLSTGEIRINYLSYFEEGFSYTGSKEGERLFFTTVYCCQGSNHAPNHCVENFDEMKNYSRKHGCKKWK